MAANEIEIAAPPARVFELLSDASLYGRWILGPQHVTGADPAWPAEGATFEHESGAGPLAVHGTTTVLEAEPGRRLVMSIDYGAAGSVRSELTLEDLGGATRVTMLEEGDGGLAGLAHNPVADVALRARNVVSLGRLKELAES
jgi:uncharacterized protein YndB with AHSA1/START domain